MECDTHFITSHFLQVARTMKTLILDLHLNLRGVSDHAEFHCALREILANGLIDSSQKSHSIEDWNFLRVPDDFAQDVLEWQSLGSPSRLNPLIHLDAWRARKKPTL